MQYTVWRGAEEIGGMCIEVAAEDGTRVLLDLGMPLYDEDGKDYSFGTPQRPTEELLEAGVLRDIPGLFECAEGASPVAAIILTHSHLDHYGLAHHAHPSIPVYGSRGTIAILEVGRVFFPDVTLPGDLRVLPETEPLRIGSVSVTPIPVDHAAPDSRALLVEADGERLLYSGDLRAHGRTGFRFEKLLADERVAGVDWLLLEGTTLGVGSETHGLRSEQEVEESLLALAQGQPDKLVAVIASGQNLDRLVSCYRTAKQAGRLLVVDPYQAYVLMKLAPLSEAIPQFGWQDVKVSFAPHQVDKLKEAGLIELVYEMGREAKVSSGELAADPGRYLLTARGSYGTSKLLNHIGADRVELVWSLWKGYWDREPNRLRDWALREGARTHFIHSGGHAWPEDLERLTKALGPRNLEFVHTSAKTAGERA